MFFRNWTHDIVDTQLDFTGGTLKSEAHDAQSAILLGLNEAKSPKDG